MARYAVYAKLVVEFESPRTPAQIRNALAVTGPTLRAALKAAWRTQLAKDASGQTVPISWHFHAQGNRVDTGDELDLDDGGLNDEIE